MEFRSLGQNGLKASAIGLGGMALTGVYGEIHERESIRLIHHALEIGVNFIDTADAYADGCNEELIGKAISGKRSHVVIATKFGIVYDRRYEGATLRTGWGLEFPINCSPDYARQALDASLRRLGVETIDLWYAHYPDPGIPIEATVQAMAEAVQSGKVRYLGLSNATAEQVRRAHRIHPISAVQGEYSLWQREYEKELLPVLRELGIGFIPWAPLGTGFLTGTVQRLNPEDFRNRIPRFQNNNFSRNLDHYHPIMALAKEKGITPAQLALAWLLHQYQGIVPIPGTTSLKHLEENAASVRVVLTERQLDHIASMTPEGYSG